jgi:Lysyl oxidase
MKPVRRTLSGLCAFALAATMGAAVALPAQSESNPKAPLPPLKLQTASAHLTLDQFGHRVYLNLGVYAVAGDGAFVVYAHRDPSYVGPITAQVSLNGGPLTDIPDGMLTNFRGLTDFLHIVVKDTDGKTVYHASKPFCPGYGTTRVRPAAPDTSPYPQDCPYNPFTLGGVYGVEKGFGAPAPDQYGRPVKLEAGRYTATVNITKPWRDVIGVSGADARVSVGIRVVKGQGCYYPDGPVPAPRGCRAEPGKRHTSSEALGKIPRHPAAHRPTGPGMKAAPDPGTLPDLQSLPAYGLELTKRGFLNFAATEWDAGPAPMVIDGFRNPKAQIMGTYQYFYNSDGTAAGHKRIGKMEWDPRPGHQHWHFEDFVSYRLLDATQSEVVRSRKNGFCLANTDAVDFTVPNADWNPYNTDLATSCGDLSSLAVREVLLTGSGDTYYQSKPGQSFNVKNLPNGIYYVQIEVNPNGNMFEADDTNNTSLRKIKLTGAGANRSVKVFPVGDIDAN